LNNVVHWFWGRTAQLRNRMDAGISFHEAQATAMETALCEFYSDLCEPWFDGSQLPQMETDK
jgi:predicted solute-binding protein